MLSQIQANTNKAYVALQTYTTSPAHIAIPGVVHTDRPHLTRKQIAARYLKSIEGNSDIDINKAESGERDRTPKMVQKSGKSLPDTSGMMDSYPHTAYEIKAHQTSRTLMQTSICSRDFTVSQYIKAVSKSEGLEYNLFDTIANDDCIYSLPQFVICSNRNVKLIDTEIWQPWQVVAYRPVTVSDHCDYSLVNCLEPATTPEKINLQINELLKKDKGTRIYLTPEQLEGYLIWRLQHGYKGKFPHIRVEDKGSSFDRNFAYGACTVGGIIGLLTLCLPIYFRSRKHPSDCSSQTITCINRSSEGRQSATDDTTAENDDPAESSTSSSTIIDSIDSTTEDSDDAAEMIDIQNKT